VTGGLGAGVVLLVGRAEYWTGGRNVRHKMDECHNNTTFGSLGVSRITCYFSAAQDVCLPLLSSTLTWHHDTISLAASPASTHKTYHHQRNTRTMVTTPASAAGVAARQKNDISKDSTARAATNVAHPTSSSHTRNGRPSSKALSSIHETQGKGSHKAFTTSIL
jgi:hypothetical protein